MSEVLVLRRPRPPAIVPPLLSFTAGFIDSFTFLALFGLFVAQVTGSFVLAAAAIATNEQGALTQLLAIPVFLLAGVTTTALAVMLERRGRAALAWLLGLECAVLTGLLLTALIGAPLSDPNAATVAAASLLGLFAMGTQSATVRLLMKDVASTNVMTTNTTQIANLTIQGDPVEGVPPHFVQARAPVVLTRGCEYLLMPGLRALRALAGGRWATRGEVAPPGEAASWNVVAVPLVT